MTTKRLGIGFTDSGYNRMKELTEKFEISQSKLLECLLCLPDEQIKAQIDKAAPELATSKKALKEKSKEIAQKLSTLTPERRAAIEALLNQQA